MVKSKANFHIEYERESPGNCYVCFRMEDIIEMLYANKDDPVKMGNLVMLERNDISEADPLRK